MDVSKIALNLFTYKMKIRYVHTRKNVSKTGESITTLKTLSNVK